MATYAKLPLMAQDYPLGYQTVNQAADNIEAVRAAFAAEHLLGFGGGIPTLPPPPGGAYSTGHHNVATIVRSLDHPNPSVAHLLFSFPAVRAASIRSSASPVVLSGDLGESTR